MCVRLEGRKVEFIAHVAACVGCPEGIHICASFMHSAQLALASSYHPCTSWLLGVQCEPRQRGQQIPLRRPFFPNYLTSFSPHSTIVLTSRRGRKVTHSQRGTVKGGDASWTAKIRYVRWSAPRHPKRTDLQTDAWASGGSPEDLSSDHPSSCQTRTGKLLWVT